VAIKHEILKMMVQDELKAQALAAKAEEVLVAHGRGKLVKTFHIVDLHQ
jgi:hypothetical protein